MTESLAGPLLEARKAITVISLHDMRKTCGLGEHRDCTFAGCRGHGRSSLLYLMTIFPARSKFRQVSGSLARCLGWATPRMALFIAPYTRNYIQCGMAGYGHSLQCSAAAVSCFNIRVQREVPSDRLAGAGPMTSSNACEAHRSFNITQKTAHELIRILRHLAGFVRSRGRISKRAWLVLGDRYAGPAHQATCRATLGKDVWISISCVLSF